MVETVGVLASKLRELGGEPRAGCSDPPRFQHRVPVFVGHAKGAAVAQGLVQVEFVDEAEDLGLTPAEGPFGPFKADLPPPGAYFLSDAQEVAEQSH